jgi:hypothetical protein
MQSLSEFHDRMLAMAGGEWIDLATGKAVLESWFSRQVSLAELSAAVNELLDMGFLTCRASQTPLSVLRVEDPCMLEIIDIRSTRAGDSFLSATSGITGS